MANFSKLLTFYCLKWCPIFNDSTICLFTKYNNFLRVPCWFLAKNISIFYTFLWNLTTHVTTILITHLIAHCTIQLFWNSIDSVQEALDLTVPAKNRRKMRIIDLNFQIKKLISLVSRLVWNWSSKFTTHSLVFCEM